MQENKLFTHPSNVKWGNRGRQEYGRKELEELKQSITSLGQLQPIIVTRDFELVIGGRRTKACLDLDREIWYSFADSIDPIWLREAELAENVHRDDMLPAEVVLMKDEIRKMREERGEKATVREVSAILGESKSQTAEDLKLACFVRAAPQLFSDCKTKSELRAKVKEFERKAKWNRLADAVDNLPAPPVPEQKRGQTSGDYTAERIRTFQERLKVGDAFTALQALPEGSVHIFLLDPPYGIDKGGEAFDDSEASFRRELPILFQLCYEKAAAESYMLCFFAVRHLQFVFSSAEAAGFHCLERPIVVCKEAMGGNTTVPDIWPGAAYELLLLARKGNRKLVQRGRPDYLTIRPLAPSEKLGHPSAKPPALYADLLQWFAYPGETVCDPMYGTGAAFVGCEMLPELHLQWFGWDIDKTNKAKALMNLSQYVLGVTQGRKEP